MAANTRLYRSGALVEQDFPVSTVSDHLSGPDTMVWIDLLTPTQADLEQLQEELDWHPLAVEDALSPHQRPKLDRYATHLFLSLHAATLDPQSLHLGVTEVDVFLGERWIITVRKNDGFGMDEVRRRWDRTSQLAAHGVNFLLYGLLDTVVDGHFVTAEAFDRYYDDVSERLFSEHPLDPTEQKQWFDMRRALVHFHRLVAPLREVVSGLMRHDQHGVGGDLYPYFQDVYDHVLRINDTVDTLRDLTVNIVETNLSLRDYRQNQIMKKVTSWAAIVAVPTLITGWYGMNVPYPGTGEHWGWMMAGGLSAALSAGLFTVFRRRDWL